MSYAITQLPPLSLYIHLPWCIRKCPYCDFNSHAVKSSIPEDLYVTALLQELDERLVFVQNRSLISIFFGGGTPSLFSGNAIARVLEGVAKRIPFVTDIEITLEANPGTVDQARFVAFRTAGVNRLSLGIQSLQDDKLQALGRIHNGANARDAIRMAKQAGFTNLNLDLMYGLPQQSIDDAVCDLQTAIDFVPTHLSWYQLTIEPNTLFHHCPPTLPSEETIWDMQLAGQECLAAAGFQQYEVSAYAQPQRACRHNRHYWEFGDYLGLGAGAHSKITDLASQHILRFSQVKHPQDYLNPAKRMIQPKTIARQDRVFEFMLNALRLTHGVPYALLTERTGVAISQIASILNETQQRGLLLTDSIQLCATTLGQRFLNDVIGLFLNESSTSLTE